MYKLLKLCKTDSLLVGNLSGQFGKLSISNRFSTLKPTDKPTTTSSTDLLSQILEDTNETPKGQGNNRAKVRKPDEAWCLVRKIPYSTYKMSPVVNKLPGLPYQEAFVQLSRAPERFAKDFILKALQSARYNAENNHNLDPEKLVVHECWVGKDQNVKDIRMHARGRRAMMIHPFSRLNLILKQVDDPLAYFRQRTMKKSEKRKINKQRKLVAAKTAAQSSKSVEETEGLTQQ